MKVTVNVSDEQEITIHTWWAKSPEWFVRELRSHLAAAQSVWPELSAYAIVKREPRKSGDKAKAGAAGGEARAAALPADRRSEIASIAANARWQKPKETTT